MWSWIECHHINSKTISGIVIWVSGRHNKLVQVGVLVCLLNDWCVRRNGPGDGLHEIVFTGWHLLEAWRLDVDGHIVHSEDLVVKHSWHVRWIHVSDLAQAHLKLDCSVDLVSTVRSGHGHLQCIFVIVLVQLRIYDYFTVACVQCHEIWDHTRSDVHDGSNGGCSTASSLADSNLWRCNQRVSILSGVADIELMSWNQSHSGVLLLDCRVVIGDSIALTGGRSYNHLEVYHMSSMAWIVVQ